MRPRTLVATLLVMAVIAFTWWTQRLADSMEARDESSDRDRMDYFLENFRMESTDDQGRLRHRLQGRRLEHHLPADTALILAPRLTWMFEEGPPATLSAERAEAGPGGHEILLAGRVHLRRPAWGGHDRLDAVTRNVRLLPEAQQALGDDPVHARGEHYDIRGRGLRINLVDGTLELLHEVHAIHEP